MRNVLSSRTTMTLSVSELLALPVDVDLEYDALDPCAVRMVLYSPSGRVDRAFARDLLLAGVTQPTGEGTVHVQPAGIGDVTLTLRAPAGNVVLRTQAAALVAFLIWTDQVVPFGDERVVDVLDDSAAAALAGLPPTAAGAADRDAGISYTLRLEHGDLALALSGQLDYGQAPALERLECSLERAGDLEVDMSGVTFMDSTGVNFLTRLRERARERRSALVVTGLRAQPLAVARRLDLPLFA